MCLTFLELTIQLLSLPQSSEGRAVMRLAKLQETWQVLIQKSLSFFNL